MADMQHALMGTEDRYFQDLNTEYDYIFQEQRHSSLETSSLICVPYEG